MKQPNKYRAKCKTTNKWVYGYYAAKPIMAKHFILQEEIVPYSPVTILAEIEVIPETVGQIRYENHYGEYYDGDIYCHAGYGFVTVSALCELQNAMVSGTTEDIGEIKGYVNPDLSITSNDLIELYKNNSYKNIIPNAIAAIKKLHDNIPTGKIIFKK